MKNIIYLLIAFLLCSCKESRNNESTGILDIPIGITQLVSLPLSTIAEDIQAIELELNDESVMNPDRIKRIFFTDSILIIAEQYKLFVFNINGKFICAIGNRGPGPGDFLRSIRNFTMDEKNRCLFVVSHQKIFHFNIDGKLIKTFEIDSDKSPIRDINFINNELWLVVENERRDINGPYNHSVLYKMNTDFQITDSFPFRDTYYLNETFINSHQYEDFILRRDTIISLYCSEVTRGLTKVQLLRDTLYSFKNNCLIPELKLNFKNNGIDGNGKIFINLLNLYRSSRYVFANYDNFQDGKRYKFCFDTKTGKGYNVSDGYNDDINQTVNPVSIRPHILNTELFYYWHTNIRLDGLEEPNPTLYIGRLRK